MANASDGMTYAPKGKPAPVVKPGEFKFAAAYLDHGHIYGQAGGLSEAGGECKWIFDTDPARAKKFQEQHPQAQLASSFDQILDDPEIRLVAAAAIPNERGPIGCKVLRAGKDYFTDKTPFTSLDQLAEARKAAAETNRKYMVYYSERLHVEAAVFASEIITEGAIGRVVQVIGLGPHRLNAPSRPKWFFEKEKYGGILADIGSHQAEQFLYYTGAKDGRVAHAAVANYFHKDYPELEDFGEMNPVGDNNAVGYFRVDWLTPQGLRTWGDGRTILLGEHGYIEMRKYIDVARDSGGNQLFLVNQDGEKHYDLTGKVGYPFFGRLIRDCIERTETAMSQEHAFKAAELCLKAQAAAISL